MRFSSASWGKVTGYAEAVDAYVLEQLGRPVPDLSARILITGAGLIEEHGASEEPFDVKAWLLVIARTAVRDWAFEHGEVARVAL